MKKIAIVFWSGTGNTKIMADEIAIGAREQGAEIDLFAASEFRPELVQNYDALAFGCPSMGLEVLEEDEFEPMFTAVEGTLSGKRVGLFGSYGWGDGQWMRDWVARCKQDHMALVEEEGLIVNETPDEEGRAHCRSLGSLLAQ